MEIVVTGRHFEVSEGFRRHVADKLAKLEKHDHRIMRFLVEVENERNPRQADRAVRVQITAVSKGPVVRAEAAAEDKMAALDMALDKIASQMRRAADRRRDRRATKRAQFVPPMPVDEPAADTPATDTDSPIEMTGDGPLLVREKTHTTAPMTLDQALYEMELVGHDFYLYVDRESGRPCVLYRRRGYDYGVLSLQVVESEQ